MNNNNVPQDAADKQRELPLTYAHAAPEEQGQSVTHLAQSIERSNNLLIEATVTSGIRRVDKLIRENVRIP